MDSSISYNDAEHIESYLSKSQYLEMAYQDTLRNTDLIIMDESARRLRLRILTLENENDDLHEELSLGYDRIDVLEQDGEDLRGQLGEAQEDSCRQEADLRAQAREMNNLKAELSSMKTITTDSAKLLTEKLSLARELATLKLELEHLRSQVSYQQTVLAEKLALQRQVSTLEVELETEKRVSKRATQKSRSNERDGEIKIQLEDLQKELAREKRDKERARKDADNELQQQIEELQKELLRERRENERARKEMEADLKSQLEGFQKDMADEKREEKARRGAERDLKASEARRTVLESKLDEMRMKLKATREQLRECQTELSDVSARAAKISLTTTTGTTQNRNLHKRNALEMSTDVNIGTPDGVAVRGRRPAGKKGRADQMMMGEKSMFSITPYLNRTLNIPVDTPTKDTDAEIVREDHKDQISRDATLSPERLPNKPLAIGRKSSASTVKLLGKKKGLESTVAVATSILGEVKDDAKNKPSVPKRPRALATMAEVAEEEIDENGQIEIGEPDSRGVSVKTAALVKAQIKSVDPEVVEPKKKKRKLLGGGKTLFDEDDGETTRRPSKIALGPARLLGKGGSRDPKNFAAARIGTSNAFGTFSPLKRDRRGVGAGFLA